MQDVRLGPLGRTASSFLNLAEETTVWELKALIDERLLLRPEQTVKLYRGARSSRTICGVLQDCRQGAS